MTAKPQPRPPALTYHERQTADRLRHVFAALVGGPSYSVGADLTARQTALLLWLAAADRPARAGEAAGALEGLPTGTHAPYVNARLLHRRGLVARANDPANERYALLSLTDAGRAVVRRLVEAADGGEV